MCRGFLIQKYNAQSLYSLTLVTWPKEDSMIFPTGTQGPGMMQFAQTRRWCHRCLSRDTSRLSCAAMSAPFLSVRHRTALSRCATCCSVATGFTITTDDGTLPSLITSRFLCRPDLERVLSSGGSMLAAARSHAARWGCGWAQAEMVPISCLSWAPSDRGAAEETPPSFSLSLCALHGEVAFKKNIAESYGAYPVHFTE